jgi:CO dehydrogenase/acetyl-CoA synthase delta subunit
MPVVEGGSGHQQKTPADGRQGARACQQHAIMCDSASCTLSQPDIPWGQVAVTAQQLRR